MEPTVVIRKDDLQKNPDLGHKLSQFSDKVKEHEDTCQYFPSEGKMVGFMKILLEYDLDYSLQYVE
jgi:hypothetical protein